MTFHNPHADSTNDPAVARRAAMVVYGEITVRQRAQVQAAYALFKLRGLSSIAGYQLQDRSLPDGTRYRIICNSGQDIVYVWPADEESNLSVVDLFWGIPANAGDRDGPASLPSAYWRIGDKLQMPAALKPKRVIDVSDSKAHPGHVTWSNPAIKANGRPVVISWRGPRDRYSSSSGWSPDNSSTTGLTVIAHAEAANALGLPGGVLRDSSAVWINGRKVTIRNKIIAAAVVRISTSPDRFALRVLTDNASGDLATYQLGCYDYVPTGATAAVDLGDLLTATSYILLASYPCGTGLRLAQRPHFNASGTEFAAQRRFATPGGSFSDVDAVRVNPTTWVVLQAVAGANDSVRTGAGATIADNAPATPRVVTIDETFTDTTTDRRFLAVDFVGDTFAYVTSQLQRIRSSSRTSNSNAGVVSESGTITDAYTLTVTHSTLGVLANHAWNEDWTFSVAASVTTMGAIAARFPLVCFIGDLAKGIFALAHGSPLDTDIGTATGNYPGTTNPVAPFEPGAIGSVTTHGWTASFDLWADGAIVAAGTSGSYTDVAIAADTTNAGQFRSYGITLVDQYLGAGYTPPVNSSSLRAGQVPNPTLIDLQHIAVNPRKTIAYVGGHFTLSGNRWGIEAALFKTPLGGWTVEPVPAYAGGTRPTISAPVFTGVLTTGQ